MNKGGISDLDRLRKKEEAFNRLSSLSKTDVEDVFSKLPKPAPKAEKAGSENIKKRKEVKNKK